MSIRIGASKAVSILTASAMALTAVIATPAFAASKNVQVAVASENNGITDISARRRHYRHYGNGAAALGAFAAIAGTIASIAAAQRYRHGYGYPYGYYGGPYGYAPYYGRPYPFAYYGPRYRYW